MYADYILLQSENTRNMYLEKLVEFTGEEAREVWERKLKVAQLYDNDTQISSDRKTIIYCIGVNELAQKGMDSVHKIEERLEIFAENSTRLKVMIYMYPFDLNIWNDVDGGVTQQIIKLLEKYTEQEWCEICSTNCADMEDIAKESDAYYGSPSPLVLMFTAPGKPVMISR